MTTSIPLPIWPWPMTDERLALLKQAKASLNVDVLVVPCEAFPRSPGRILAFERPPWYCRSAPIAPENVNSVQSIAAALRFVLDDGESDAYGEAWWLSQALGCEVTEVTDPFRLDVLEFSRLNEGVHFS